MVLLPQSGQKFRREVHNCSVFALYEGEDAYLVLEYANDAAVPDLQSPSPSAAKFASFALVAKILRLKKRS